MSTQRYKARIAVTLLARSQSAAHLTESVSADGVFVRTDTPPPPMTLLRMELALPPDDELLLIHGMVANTVQPATAHAAAGVEIHFFAKGADFAARWDRFLRFLRDRHPQCAGEPVLLAREPSPTQAMRRTTCIEDFDAADVAPGGMFLSTTQRFAVGADLRVTLVNPATGDKRALACVVRRRIAGAESGIGVEYKNMTGETWADLSAFLRQNEAPSALRAEVNLVWTPYVPMIMQTLPGPWQKEVAAAPAVRKDAWSLPPEDGWGDPSELLEGVG